jgi:tripartite-type tricarboxylate transporter receptor subunit TctC
MPSNILLLMISSLIGLSASTQTSSCPPPNKPITLINPFPPGGALDAFGRPLAKQLSTQLNDSIVVDSRGGAGGTLGATVAAKMAPDGYA